jgi:hypothetical protein
MCIYFGWGEDFVVGNVSKVLSMFSIKKKRIEVLSKDSYEKL